MKLSILIVAVALFLLGSGFVNPALFFIGYLWTSVLYPTAFATTVIPLSMTFGICCLLGYFFVDKTISGSPPAVFYLAILLVAWVTFTTLGAGTEQDPWAKWNWAVQSIIITIAAPLFLRTRAQIETGFIAGFTALAAHVMTGGVKSILGTGGYDRLGRLMMSNFWLGETSTLAMACIISLPMGYYCVRHSVIFEKYRGRWLNIAFAGYAVLAVMCMVGTSARTGLMALGTLLIFWIKGIFRKAIVIAAAVGLFVLSPSFMPGKSIDRYGTISSYQQDASATVRLAVWQWAIDYAKQHPLGGGFNIFNTNDIIYKVLQPDGTTLLAHRPGSAPHSIYFEVLGEQGYPGILLYLGMLLSGLWGTFWISRLRLSGEATQWQAEFARTLFVCMTVFCVGASFVGIAFQPLLYFFLGFYCCVFRWLRAQRAIGSKFSAKADMFRPVPNQAHA